MSMSRWNLLKAAIGGYRQADSKCSIHSFSGFEGLIEIRRIIWQGFETDYYLDPLISNDEQFSLLVLSSKKYMEFVDCAECFVNLLCNESQADKSESSSELLNNLLALGVLNRIISNSNILSTSRIRISHPSLIPRLARAEFLKYSLPTVNDFLFTRERPKTMGIGVSGLLSNFTHGIDNTGNVRVWEAEQVLLFYLAQMLQKSELNLDRKTILELGGGMTGLAGLGLARICSNNRINTSITITDGHPDCVANQNTCIAMNQVMDKRNHHPSPLKNVSSRLLRWSVEDKHGDLKCILDTNKEAFDIVLASDCLFFRDFHDDLLWTIENSLKADGVVYLLQPRRGDSMSKFLLRAEATFDVEIHDTFCDEVTAHLNRARSQNSSSYNEDLHLPILCVLRKKT